MSCQLEASVAVNYLQSFGTLPKFYSARFCSEKPKIKWRNKFAEATTAWKSKFVCNKTVFFACHLPRFRRQSGMAFLPKWFTVKLITFDYDRQQFCY